MLERCGERNKLGGLALPIVHEYVKDSLASSEAAGRIIKIKIDQKVHSSIARAKVLACATSRLEQGLQDDDRGVVG